MISHKYVDDYMKQWEKGEISVNEDRELLFVWIKEKIYPRTDIYFDEEQIENCIKFIEKWYFELLPFQKFLIAFVFLKFKGEKKIVFNQHFWTMGRGAGKNGLISGICHYLISELHDVKGYNIGIVATSEDQAVTSVNEVFDTIDDNPPLQSHFKHTATRITSKGNRNTFRYYTSNAKTKDGARLGAIVFDEVHEYQNNDIIGVFTTGFGKRPYSRRFYISTTGFVRDGVYDDLLKRSRDVLTGKKDSGRFFPFICRIDDIDDMHKVDNWQKSNPMFHPPMTEYGKTLLDEVQSHYDDLSYGGDKIQFIVKNMNFDEIAGQNSVASKQDIDACNVPLPDLTGEQAIGVLDLSSNKDFTSMGLVFRRDEHYYFKTHSFVPKGFLDNYSVEAPIKEWETADFGKKRPPLLTVIDEVDIPIEMVVEWFVMQRDKYDIKTIVIDKYRKDYAEKALLAAGFEVIVVYKSNAISAGIGIRVQSIFSRRQLHWGVNPLMSWFTNNVLVTRDTYQNIVFGKRTQQRYKTDGFMALMLGIWQSDELLSAEAEDFMFADFWD